MSMSEILLPSADGVLTISTGIYQIGVSLKLVVKLLTYTTHEPLLTYCSGQRSLFVVMLQLSWLLAALHC